MFGKKKAEIKEKREKAFRVICDVYATIDVYGNSLKGCIGKEGYEKIIENNFRHLDEAAEKLHRLMQEL